MTTARDICTRALVLSGISANGESIGADDGQFALDSLNEMLDSWSVDSSFIYVTNELVGTVSGASFTVGPAGTIACAFRPTTMEPGAYTVISGISYPLVWVTEKEFNQIPYPANPGPNPWWGFYSADLPLGMIKVYPTISVPVEIHLNVNQLLSEFPDLDTDYQLSPGYRQAIIYSLAELLCAGVRQVDPVVARTAMKARKAIQRLNTIVPVLDLPSAVLPNYGGYWYNS